MIVVEGLDEEFGVGGGVLRNVHWDTHRTQVKMHPFGRGQHWKINYSSHKLVNSVIYCIWPAFNLIPAIGDYPPCIIFHTSPLREFTQRATRFELFFFWKISSEHFRKVFCLFRLDRGQKIYLPRWRPMYPIRFSYTKAGFDLRNTLR